MGTEFAQSGCHGLKVGRCTDCIDVLCSWVLQTLINCILSSLHRPPFPIHYLPGGTLETYRWVIFGCSSVLIQMHFIPGVDKSCPLAHAGVQFIALISLSCCCALGLQCIKYGTYKGQEASVPVLNESPWIRSVLRFSFIWFYFVSYREGKHNNQYKGAQCFLSDSKIGMIFVVVLLGFSLIMQSVEKQSGKEMYEGRHRARLPNHIHI